MDVDKSKHSKAECSTETEKPDANPSRNIFNSCRFCMNQHLEMNEIFNEVSNSQDICEKVTYCTGLQIKQHDGLPSLICKICLSNLFVSYKFKTTSIKCNEILQKLAKDLNIKQESTVENQFDTDTADAYFETDEILKNDAKVDADDIKLFVKEHSEIKGAKKREKNTAPKKIRASPRNIVKVKREPTNSVTSATSKNLPLIPDVSKKKKCPRKGGSFGLTCDLCDVKFTNKEDCNKHKKDLHKNKEYICETCGKVYKSHTSHYIHKQTHEPPKYACDVCDYKTWYRYNLVKHMTVHTGVKLYQCEFCPSSFSVASNLLKHARNMHGGVKRHACLECGKRFHERGELSKHVDSHNDIKRYTCEVCQTLFSRRNHWKKHLFRQHGIFTPKLRPGRKPDRIIVSQTDQPTEPAHQSVDATDKTSLVEEANK